MSAYFGPPIGGTTDTPRLQIKAGGVLLPGAVTASVTLTNTWTAARWSAGIALLDTDQYNAAWWASQSDVRIEIDFSTDGQNFTNVLSGITDEIEIAPDTNYVTLSGRDLTALLIDIKTASTYQNQTSSEIAAILAQAVGLTPVVTATKTPIGQYYANDHTRMSMGDLAKSITDWDLLTYLAQQESFDVFVQGSSLYFQPMATSAAAPFSVQWARTNDIATANVMNLSLKRSLTLAKDVSVTVQSWNSYLNKEITATATSKANGTSSAGAPQKYVFYKPNLTPAQAADFVNQQLSQITRHERVISFETAGELSLMPQSVIALSGTNTAFDQLYYPDEITRSMDFKGGFRQSVTARNHTASNQVALAAGGGTSISSLGF